MSDISKQYADLVFTPQQIFLSAEECYSVAQDFWSKSVSVEQFTDRDRAFIQGVLLIAVDKSEKAGFAFDIWSSFVGSAPSRSVQKLVKSLAKKAAKRWFKAFIDSDPEISAVGKSAVQYSAFTSQWKVRVSTGDDSFLSNFLVR
jgi:hypothetical protein